MHSSMLAPGLLALVSASTVAAQTCGNSILTIGHECASGMRDGDRVCDATCSDILVCHDGKMRLNNPCAPGHCVWREDASLAFCSEYEARAAEAAEELPVAIPDEDPRPPRECGFTQELGQKCSILLKEGGQLCDKACQNVLVCSNGIMELSQACGKENVCDSDDNAELGKGASCKSDQDGCVFVKEPVPRHCGPGGQIGNSCGELIKEGWQLCDPGCNKIVRCRHGKIEQAQDCAPGRCDSKINKPFGQAAFCTTPSSSTDSARVSGLGCDEAREVARAASDAYEEAIRTWCQTRSFVDESMAHRAYEIGMETSRWVQELCYDNQDSKLPFNPDDDQHEDFYKDLLGCHDSGHKLGVATHEDGTLTAPPVDCGTAEATIFRAGVAHDKMVTAWLKHQSKTNLKKVLESYKKLIMLIAELSEACSLPDDSDDDMEASDHAQCGPIQHTAGDPCLQDSEGQTHCDNSCERILICHDHTLQVNNECPGSCAFIPDVNAAFCV